MRMLHGLCRRWWTDGKPASAHACLTYLCSPFQHWNFRGPLTYTALYQPRTQRATMGPNRQLAACPPWSVMQGLGPVLGKPFDRLFPFQARVTTGQQSASQLDQVRRHVVVGDSVHVRPSLSVRAQSSTSSLFKRSKVHNSTRLFFYSPGISLG